MDDTQCSHKEKYSEKNEVLFKSGDHNMDNVVSAISITRPKDKLNLVYVIFVLLGIGSLIPWNVFINAKKYFMDYKLNTTTSYDSDYRKNFMQYIGIAAQVPNIIMSAANTFYQGQGSLSHMVRFIAVVIIKIVVLLFTVALAVVDSFDWPNVFFCLTILSVIILNCCTGIYQSIVYGLAGQLPPKYINAAVLGTNLCGTIIAICNIITKFIAISFSDDSESDTLVIKNGAIIYFCCAIVVLILCFAMFMILDKSTFYRYHISINEEEIVLNDEKTPVLNENGGISTAIDVEADDPTVEKPLVALSRIDEPSVLRQCFGICCICPYSDGSKRCSIYWHDYWNAFRYCWVHCLSVFSVFFCTLAVFPGIHANVKVVDENFFLAGKWFTDVTCFLSFNLFALIGNFISNWVQFPSPKFLWIPVWLRTFIIIPFFMFSNFYPDKRKIPILILNDYVFQIGAILYGFTSGYFSSLCMMYSPKTAPAELMGHAARITAFFLVLGLVCGINASLLIVKICAE